jgi:hypothetical protein
MPATGCIAGTGLRLGSSFAGAGLPPGMSHRRPPVPCLGVLCGMCIALLKRHCFPLPKNKKNCLHLPKKAVLSGHLFPFPLRNGSSPQQALQLLQYKASPIRLSAPLFVFFFFLFRVIRNSTLEKKDAPLYNSFVTSRFALRVSITALKTNWHWEEPIETKGIDCNQHQRCLGGREGSCNQPVCC